MRLRKSLAYRGALPPVISLLKLLVDEVLRWESPGRFLMRQATPDVEMSGTIIPAGALVMVRSFRDIIQRMDNIRLSKPLPMPVHNFSMFFLPIHDFYIEFDKCQAGC